MQIFSRFSSGIGPPVEVLLLKPYGYQAIILPDVHGLWTASLIGGLRRSQALNKPYVR
ncbi:MAG TPA: hypothetical protein PLE10_09890 [Brevefilum sp.]|nr:hypothetical protein [Brevefilum sp.]HOR20118.1 hypothetical protein [Brevefilum sp.]HPL69229.1 hypothetical protein [Brevefilum sp.]